VGGLVQGHRRAVMDLGPKYQSGVSTTNEHQTLTWESQPPMGVRGLSHANGHFFT